MFKNVAASLIVLLLLTACSSTDEGPQDLSGVWTSVESADSDSYVSAIIRDGEMEITDIAEDGMRSLYWVGTVPETVSPGDIFLSEGDVERLSSAILASTLEEKEFTFTGDEIVFERGLMGMSWDVTMRKVN